ncbi:MAG: hypothetical protein ACK4M9_13095 [Anaerobacillus sp.]|uniref:hypothetical protein n=1 Tax=Anaerobacillus sp. TaxID=1872506 RepID=UPI00391C17CC
MKKFNLFMTFFIIAMLVIGCASSSSNSKNVEVKFLNEGQVLSTESFNTYSVKLVNNKGDAIDAEKVYLYLNMKMMNHPIEGTMKRVDIGLYELELPLAMAGEWYANVTVTVEGETIEFSEFAIIAEGPKQVEWMKGYHADQQ